MWKTFSSYGDDCHGFGHGDDNEHDHYQPSPAMVMIMIIMVTSMIIMIMTSYDMTMITSFTTSPESGHMQPKYTGAGVSENIKSCLVLPSWVYNSRTLSFRSSRRS